MKQSQKARQKKLKLLDINSEQELAEPPQGTAEDSSLLPAEKGVAFCNRLFYMERLYKELPQEETKNRNARKQNLPSGMNSGHGWKPWSLLAGVSLKKR